VKTVVAGRTSLALTRYKGAFRRVRPGLRSARCARQRGCPLDAALAAAFAHDGPSLVEVMTDPELV
jgi:thiamine pyrophosphate-dependent acetolactate synthase large subunit-like protein